MAKTLQNTRRISGVTNLIQHVMNIMVLRHPFSRANKNPYNMPLAIVRPQCSGIKDRVSLKLKVRSIPSSWEWRVTKLSVVPCFL